MAQLVEAAERVFDSHVAEINIDCRNPVDIRVGVLLKPERQNINISFSIDP